jgi:LacI family transcriptional regulator
MKKRSEVTIHDIARKLNISASTVSRALKDNPLISKKMRDYISSIAEDMGYRPNVIASNLRTRRTNNIGIIVPWINRHFFSSVVSGAEEIAYNEGFTVTIAQSNDNYLKETRITRALFNSRVDGVIISYAMETLDFAHIRIFSEKDIPLVIFDRDIKEIPANKIVVDDFNGGLMATEHLIGQGCKNIAHISGPLHLSIYEDRFEGYLTALRQAGYAAPAGGILHNRLTRADGEAALRQLLELRPLPDAIFCGNDTTALSIISALRDSPLKVPDDIAIVGFSNEPYSALVTPSITTIRQPGYEMGKKAAELIISEIRGCITPADYRTYTMPTELITRQSSVKRKTER